MATVLDETDTGDFYHRRKFCQHWCTALCLRWPELCPHVGTSFCFLEGICYIGCGRHLWRIFIHFKKAFGWPEMILMKGLFQLDCLMFYLFKTGEKKPNPTLKPLLRPPGTTDHPSLDLLEPRSITLVTFQQVTQRTQCTVQHCATQLP